MKKFLIVGSKSAITFKDVFPYMKDRKVLSGVNMINVFTNGDEVMKFGNIGWFTTMEHHHYDPLVLTKTFNEKDYPKYDNYDAINVDKVKDIPIDYYDVMGVPITFLDKWDGSEFEVIGFRKGLNEKDLYIDGKDVYFRILIRRKKSMKKFLIVGTQNIISYKEIFPLLMDKKAFINKKIMFFDGQDNEIGVACVWLNNIGCRKKEPLTLTKTYNEKDYPKYDNYDAIEVSRVKDIPVDYDGVMGVPITFLDKWDGGGFEVIGLASDYRVDEPWCIMGSPTYVDEKHKDSVKMVLDGKAMYSRILIKRIP